MKYQSSYTVSTTQTLTLPRSWTLHQHVVYITSSASQLRTLPAFTGRDPRSTRTGDDITKSFFSTIERQVPQRARRRRYGNERSSSSYSYWMSNGFHLNLNNRSLSKRKLFFPRLSNYCCSYFMSKVFNFDLSNQLLSRSNRSCLSFNNYFFSYWCQTVSVGPEQSIIVLIKPLLFKLI